MYHRTTTGNIQRIIENQKETNALQMGKFLITNRKKDSLHKMCELQLHFLMNQRGNNFLEKTNIFSRFTIDLLQQGSQTTVTSCFLRE